MTTYEQIFEEAVKSAEEAIKNAGPERTFAFDCGFAWVIVHPARGPFITWCKKQIKNSGIGLEGLEKHFAEQGAEILYGHKAYGGGWQFWQPGHYSGQSIHIHKAGARAFAKVLNQYGINAYADSRLD